MQVNQSAKHILTNKIIHKNCCTEYVAPTNLSVILHYTDNASAVTKVHDKYTLKGSGDGV
jgi:hypothetical protein